MTTATKRCLACDAEIPATAIINGRRMALSKRKYCFACSPYGSRNTRTILPGSRHTRGPVEIRCTSCFRKYSYLRSARRGATRVFCNSCVANRKRTSLKAAAVAYKGGACCRCGYNKCLRSMVFHHTDPASKDFTIATRSVSGWAKLMLELDKTLLVCANCHGELHELADRESSERGLESRRLLR